MRNQSIKIGIPELNEEQLIEIINDLDRTIRHYIFSKINLKFIEDINLNIILQKEEELALTINIELIFYYIKIPNADNILNDALKIGETALRNKIKTYKK